MGPPLTLKEARDAAKAPRSTTYPSMNSAQRMRDLLQYVLDCHDGANIAVAGAAPARSRSS